MLSKIAENSMGSEANEQFNTEETKRAAECVTIKKRILRYFGHVIHVEPPKRTAE